MAEAVPIETEAVLPKQPSLSMKMLRWLAAPAVGYYHLMCPYGFSAASSNTRESADYDGRDVYDE